MADQAIRDVSAPQAHSSDSSPIEWPTPWEPPVDFHRCNYCRTEGPCIPLNQMSDKQLRFHIYRTLGQDNFSDAEFIRFPHLIMSRTSSELESRTLHGDYNFKLRYGIVLENFVLHMEVLVIGTSNSHGPMFQHITERINCFGVVDEGRPYLIKDDKGVLVEYAPGCGLVTISKDITYNAAIGVYGEVSYIVRVPHDTLVERLGGLPQQEF